MFLNRLSILTAFVLLVGTVRAESETNTAGPIIVIPGWQDNGKNCLLFHTTRIDLLLPGGDNKIISFDQSKLTNTSVTCTDETDKHNAKSLELTLGTTTIEFTFSRTKTLYWQIDKLSVTDAGRNYYNERSASWEQIFSYSCSKMSLPLFEINSEQKPAIVGRISFRRLQIQPFAKLDGTKASIKRFTESTDCSVWFTTPIWMGLLVILLFLTILYSGVRALMSISTPDRFENPKSRPLIISNFDE